MTDRPRSHCSIRSDRRLRLACIALCAWMPASLMPLAAQQPDAKKPDSTQQQVLAASNEWFAALMAGDLNALDRLQTDDFLAIQQGRGAVAVVTKAQQMENLRKSGADRPTFERALNAVKVREYGNVAVLTALATYKQSGPRRDGAMSRAVISEVWVNEKGRWRLAHFQPTDVPAKPRE